jgi:indolepyruvate ferredoxin oxidoreductase alpha subunit
MKELMLGNEAIARGAYEAGVKHIISYPGTPSTEITEFASQYKEIFCQWSVNEKVSFETAFGASLMGNRAMTCLKHVGLNVAADSLFTAAYTGVNAGLVIVCADDPGMYSSQNEQDSRQIARAAHVPVLEPSDAGEAKDMVLKAFEISEEYDTPVMLRITTRLAHQRSLVELCDRQEVPSKEYTKNPAKYVMMPGMARKRHIVVEDRERRLSDAVNTSNLNRMEIKNSDIGIIAAGAVYEYVREVMPNASLLKLGISYPIPKEMIKEFASRVKKLYVVEELEPVIETEIAAMGIEVMGKCLTGLQGELSPEKLCEIFKGEKQEVKASNLPMRPPVLCPGCPHRASFYALKKLKLTVFGDIGCYTLGTLAPLSSMDASLCMGASIGMLLGAYLAKGKDFSKKAVAVIGDSTFLHSGIQPLVSAVSLNAAITVVILDNRITAMTGHQPNPSTGKDIYGNDIPEVNIEKLCLAIGARVNTVNPMEVEDFTSLLKEELNYDGVSVIVAKYPCALLPNQRKPAIKVENCRNCKLCLNIGCPAILPGENGVTVDSTLCNGCGLCATICPFGSFKMEGK